MVLQAILGRLGLGGLTGLAQGGGFGLGYGFMVRAGYDLYGQMRDKVMETLGIQRYTPDTATSMAGTGGLMGLSRTDSSQPQPMPELGGYKNSGMTKIQYENRARAIGGTHKMPAYLASQRNKTRATQPYSKPRYKTIRPHVQRWENNWYNLRHGKFERFF
jgi:hypothetical protein